MTAADAVTDVTDALRLLPFLASADARALGRLARACAWRSIRRDEQLFREGGSPDGLFIIVEGRVKLVRLSRTGREQVLHIEGPGASLGDVPVVDGGGYLATAVAVTRVRVLFVPRRDLLRLCADDPDVAMGLATTIARRLRSFSALIGTLSLQTVTARLAGALVDQHLSTGERILEVGTPGPDRRRRAGWTPRADRGCARAQADSRGVRPRRHATGSGPGGPGPFDALGDYLVPANDHRADGCITGTRRDLGQFETPAHETCGGQHPTVLAPTRAAAVARFSAKSGSAANRSPSGWRARSGIENLNNTMGSGADGCTKLPSRVPPVLS